MQRIAGILKPVLRWIVYPEERAKVFAAPAIRKIQDQKIEQFPRDAEKLVLFFIEGADPKTGRDKISGGIMSIVSLCEESRAILEITNTAVLLCTFPDQYLLSKHTRFQNESDVFRFDQLEDYFWNVKQVIIHIPEYLCQHFLKYTEDKRLTWLANGKHVHINILNQNIKYMPLPETVNKIRRVAAVTSVTTAHERYCSEYYRQLYDVPLHKFSVWISPEKYQFTDYHSKKNLMVVSPDGHPMREKILDVLRAIPGLEVRVINGLTYQEYLEVITEAKWTLTFGEGLDGYLIEPIFSGAVGFAVYNDDFFTPDFKSIPTIFETWAELESRITDEIRRLDDPVLFVNARQSQAELCGKYYSGEVYRENIKAFYGKKYTYG
jgi:hypothetical protein